VVLTAPVSGQRFVKHVPAEMNAIAFSVRSVPIQEAQLLRSEFSQLRVQLSSAREVVNI
jgi:hypothetical protein